MIVNRAHVPKMPLVINHSTTTPIQLKSNVEIVHKEVLATDVNVVKTDILETRSVTLLDPSANVNYAIVTTLNKPVTI